MTLEELEKELKNEIEKLDDKIKELEDAVNEMRSGVAQNSEQMKNLKSQF